MTKGKEPLLLVLGILSCITCGDAPAQSGGMFFYGGLSRWQGSVPIWNWQYQQGLRAVAYGNGMFLAVGDGGVTATSPAGRNWVLHLPESESALLGTPADVVFAKSSFLALSNTSSNAIFQVSTDGLTWTQPVTVPGAMLSAVVYDNGRYVAVGQRDGVALVATSSDALTWTSESLTNYGPLKAVTSGMGLFVAGGDSAGLLLTSNDGMNWLVHSVATTNRVDALTFGAGLFVGSGPGHFTDSLFVSTNGSDWNGMDGPTMYGVAYGSGRFVGLQDDQDVLVSTNGVEWGFAWFNGGPRLAAPFGVTYGGGSFVMVGEGGIVLGMTPDYSLVARRQGSGAVDLTVTGGATNQVYRLQTTSDLVVTNYYRDASRWFDWVTLTNSGSSTNLVDSTATNAPRRFYRVVWP